MKELELKYGCNPNQKPSKIYRKDGELPIEVLNGKPGYINFLDAFNGWQLVKELKKATGLPAATSFKHVSPAGAAVGISLNEVERKIYWVDDMGDLSPLASAYARARGADRMSSFGDFIALSDVCDVDTARLIKREVSDGIIAPGYEPEALEILKAKKKGNYAVIRIEPDYMPNPVETKDVYGITFEQGRNELVIDDTIDVYMSDDYMDVLADGIWENFFTQKPEVLTRDEKRAWLDKMTDVALGSDAFFPFGDNVERAHRSGVKYIAQPGGSIRDDNVIETCNKYNMAMCFTGIRLFHH